MHRIQGRQLSGKGSNLIGAESTSKDRILYRCMKLGNHGDRSGKVFRFGGSRVKIVIVSPVVQIMDVRDGKGVE